MDALPLKLIDRYARPMIIKNPIKNAIDFFHMEAPSASVSMKLDPDLQTTVMADGLCRISGTRTSAKVWKTQRQAPHVCAGAEVRIAHSSSARSTSELSMSTSDWLSRDHRVHPLAG